MMQLFQRIIAIFTPRERRYCLFLACCMAIGALLEAVGIGAIFPLLSIMGDPAYLKRGGVVAGLAVKLGIGSHSGLVMTLAALLLLFYLFKNFYMAWQARVQMTFLERSQVFYAGRLFAEYLNKPYLYHLENNSVTLLRTISSGVLLLRELDPMFDTPAANNLIIGSSTGILYGVPMLIFIGMAPKSERMLFITIGAATAYLALLLLIIIRAKRKNISEVK